MLDQTRRVGFARRGLERRSIVNRVHRDGLLENGHYKFCVERRPHPAYMYYREVHPCYYHHEYYFSKPRQQRVIIDKEAWVVKIERHSPRAMRSGLGEDERIS